MSRFSRMQPNAIKTWSHKPCRACRNPDHTTHTAGSCYDLYSSRLSHSLSLSGLLEFCFTAAVDQNLCSTGVEESHTPSCSWSIASSMYTVWYFSSSHPHIHSYAHTRAVWLLPHTHLPAGWTYHGPSRWNCNIWFWFQGLQIQYEKNVFHYNFIYFWLKFAYTHVEGRP